MSMEITNNYSSYTASYACDAKRSDSKAETKVKTNTSTNSKDKVREYYEQLCKRFPQIKMNANGGIAGSSRNNIVLNLSNDCLKRMASDPDFAKKIENDIAGIPAAHEQMFAKAKSDGIEIQGFAVRINADGSMQCSCSGSTRTSGTKRNSFTQSMKKKQEERKILEEKAAKKQAAGKTYSSAREYRAYLAEKYECLQSSEYSVAINSSLLSKALGDEKTSEWLEYNLSLIPENVEKMKSTAAACGSRLISCHIKIEGYDSMTAETCVTDEVDPETEKTRERLKEKIKKIREEKKAEEKRTEENRKEEERIEKSVYGSDVAIIDYTAKGHRFEQKI